MPSRASYWWALHPELSAIDPAQLDEYAYSGLLYAEELAQEARARSNQNLRNVQAEFLPLTIADLAERDGLTVSVIRRRIGKARRALFGTIGDDALYKRLQRANKRARLPQRRCAQQDCVRWLPARRHAKRRYCDQHRSSRARVRRCRQRRLKQ